MVSRQASGGVRRPHRDDPFYASAEYRKAAYNREPSGLRLSQRKAAYAREPSGLRISEVQERQEHDQHNNEHSYEREESQETEEYSTNYNDEWAADGPVRSSISNDRSAYTSRVSASQSVSNNDNDESSSYTSMPSVPTKVPKGPATAVSYSITDSANDDDESASYVSNNNKSSAAGGGGGKSSSFSRAGHTAATPRVNNLPKNLRVSTDNHQMNQQQHQYELESLPEDREATVKNKQPFKSRVLSRDFKKPPVPDTPTSHMAVNEEGLNNIEKHRHHQKPPARIRSRQRSGKRDNDEEGEYHKYPMPSTTPKSHVAIDDDGMNNLEKVEEGEENDSKSKRSMSKRVSSLKKYLPKKMSTISDITGGEYNHEDEVDYGIDPSRGSFDLVIVPKGSGGSGGHQHESNHHHRHHHGHKERRQKHTTTHRGYTDEASTSLASASVANDTYTAKNLTYWSSLSVRAAMAVMSAKGSEVIAQKAANVVLEEGKKKHPTHDLQELATKVSVVVLEAGGDHKVAAAVAVAIMNEEKNKKSGSDTEAKKKKLVSPFKVRKRHSKGKDRECEYDDAKSSKSESSNDEDDRPKSSLQRRLRQREGEIDKRNRALELSCLEKESQANQQKEKAIKHRMASLEADLATDKMAATLAAKKAIKESESKRKADKQKKKQGASSTSQQDEALKRKEEEIERRNRALQERAKALLRAEQEIDERKKAHSERKKAQAKASNIIMNIGKTFSAGQGKKQQGGQQEQEEEDIASMTASMASKRRILEQKESEIAARNKALQDAHRLNLAKEVEIKKRMEALNAATTAVDNKAKQRELSKKEDAKRRDLKAKAFSELKAKEEEISRQNAQLEEASRLNTLKEREIAERMAALDAATSALLERANNVQQEINRRSRSSGSRSGIGGVTHGGHTPLGRVDEEQSYHSGHQGNGGPAIHDGQQQQHHQYPEPPAQYSMYHNGPTNYNTKAESPAASYATGPRGPGEFSVATPSNMMHHQHQLQHQHPQHFGRDQLPPPPVNYNISDVNDPNLTPPPPLQQSKSKGMFEQLTGKLYSILDVACDSAATGYLAKPKMPNEQDTATYNSPASNYSPDTHATGKHNGPTSYRNDSHADSPQGRGEVMPFPYVANPEPEPEPPRFKTSTMSGLTEDYNKNNWDEQTWKSWASKRKGDQQQIEAASDDGMNAALDDALNQVIYQHQHKPQHQHQPRLENGPNKLLNDALNKTMNQQQVSHTAHNKQPIQRRNESSPNNTSSNLATNQALNDALNQAMFQQQNNDRSLKECRHGDSTSVLKQPRYNNSVIVQKRNNPKNSLTKKLKAGLFSSFNKKTSTATLDEEGKVQMRMKSQHNGSMRTLAVKKFASANKANNKANMMTSRRRPTANSGAAKKKGQGQEFTFSRKSSKLEEI